MNRGSPSYVVKKFWRLAQENDLEKARQLVSKNSIDMETDNGRHNEFYTPEFIKMLHNPNSQMESVCECDADAAIITKVLLKVEKKGGGTEIYQFMLSAQNAKKIRKIVRVSEAESSDSKCN